MTVKERNEHLIKKWKFMLEPLDEKKSYQARFAKIFENTALHTDTNMLKIALPLIQRVLYSTPEIKVSNSTKNSEVLGEIETYMLIDGNTIMPDGASSFINKIATIFIEKFNNEEIVKINHIRVSRLGPELTRAIAIF